MQQLVNGTLLQGGKYRIEKVLGQGGFGITYLAEHTLLDKKVAIKEFFPKDFCDRNETTSHITLGTSSASELVAKLKLKFIKEAKNIAKLNHPNIVSIQDIFEENNTAYYLMSYVEGESLGDKLKRKGALSEQESIEYIRQIATAIEYMHSLSMNHLDIKPSNIMIRDVDNMPILIDFGTSKQYDNEGEQTSTMAPGFTHGYAPIEQYKPGGVSTFTPQTDIYALGATLFALLTGNKPPHYSEILEEGLPELPSNVSKSTREGIEHAMEIRKNKRPESIVEFLKHFTTTIEKKERNVDTFESYNNDEDVSIKSDISDIDMPKVSDIINDSLIAENTKEGINIFDESTMIIAPTSPIEKDDVVNHDAYADLGLNVMWAKSNIGAVVSSDSGDYFTWDESIVQSDNNSNLYRVPTKSDFQELQDNCEWIWTNLNGKVGYHIISKINGESIFIPASGYRYESSQSKGVNKMGFYWSSIPNVEDNKDAYYLYFSGDEISINSSLKKYSHPLRLVKTNKEND